MEKIWHCSFSRVLCRPPEEHPLLVMQSSAEKHDLEWLSQIAFETFNVPAFCVTNTSLMSMYSSGRSSGVIVEIGDGVTSIVPFHNNQVIPSGRTIFPISGWDLTRHLVNMLCEHGYTFDRTSHILNCCELKEDLCYVAQDFDSEMKKASSSKDIEKEWKFESHDVVYSLGRERFCCPEALFQPKLLELSESFSDRWIKCSRFEFLLSGQRAKCCEIPEQGLHRMIYEAILKCDPDEKIDSDICKTLFSNIIVCGGSSMFNGFKERLQKEISALVPEDMEVNVNNHPQRQFSGWTGGSQYALSTMKWIPLEEYNEYGPDIVHKYYP